MNTIWRRFSILVIVILVSFASGSRTVSAKNQDVEINSSGTKHTRDRPDRHLGAEPEVWVYYTQPGDTLKVIASRFQVLPRDIESPEPLELDQLLEPGLKLAIPRSNQQIDSFGWVLDDHEVVYSPSAIGFNLQEYVSQAGGYLSTHQEYMRSTGLTSGAEIVERVAMENSFNPRLLLAILEYQCDCVFEPLGDEIDPDYLVGLAEPTRKGLYRQLGWVANQLSLGYYGWREGLFTDLAFDDGSRVSLSPDLNAGSAAIAYLFSRLHERSEWNHVVSPGNGFGALYKKMYGAAEYEQEISEPLIPANLSQPYFILPFQQDREWGFTSGPHGAWETDGALAALDFAPASENFGCQQSDAWVVAVADGLVVRSAFGAVVLDLDGDGFENTGWAILYMHVEDRQRVTEGSYLQRGEPIGHPSCEGGPADGTHVHIARKYNGEWIAANGPLPFTMSGWIAQAGYRPYEGTLSRGDQVVVANPLSPAQAFISLAADELVQSTRVSRDLWWEE